MTKDITFEYLGKEYTTGREYEVMALYRYVHPEDKRPEGRQDSSEVRAWYKRLNTKVPLKITIELELYNTGFEWSEYSYGFVAHYQIMKNSIMRNVITPLPHILETAEETKLRLEQDAN